jgi:phage gpG-like protein
MIRKRGSWGKFDRAKRILETIVPKKVGILAVRFYKLGFTKGGGQTDDSANGWQPRKRSVKWRSGKNKGIEKPILVGKGNLKKSIRYEVISKDTVKIYTEGIEYARIHNEGLMGIAYGKHRFKMPKREFIGESKKLQKEITNIILTEMSKIFKNK